MTDLIALPLVIPYRYRAKVRRVVDGDTIDLDIDLGMYAATSGRFRLFGLNTPEVRGPERPEGLQATAFVEGWLRGAEFRAGVPGSTHEWPLVVDTHRDGKGKYGRWLGTIYRHGDPQSLNDLLIATGHAEPRNY